MNSKRKKILIIIAATLLVLIAAAIVLTILLADKKEETSFDFEAFYAEKLEKFRVENEKYQDYEVDVAFIGDSLTDMYNLEKYYPQYLTANRGISGDTSLRLETRLQVSLYDLKPKVVVMLIGANNFDTLLDNYEKIVTGILENLPESKLVLLSMTSMGKNWARNNYKAIRNNVEIKRIAELYGCPYVDLFTALLNKETDEIYENYTIDGGHLTAEGYNVFTAAVAPVLQNLLGK